MKVFYLIIFFCVGIGVVNAQPSKKEIRKYEYAKERSKKYNSIIIVYDTVLFAGEPKMVMIYDQSKFSPEHFVIKSLRKEDDLIIVKDVEHGNNEYTFPTLEHQKAYLRQSSDPKEIAGTIIHRKLISPEGLKEENVNIFLKENPVLQKGTLYKAVDKVLDDTSEKEEKKSVERNKEAPVSIKDKKIFQGSKEIAYYTETQGSYNEEQARFLKVFYLNKSICATLTFPVTTPDKCIINVVDQGVIEEISAATTTEAIEYLVENGYL